MRVGRDEGVNVKKIVKLGRKEELSKVVRNEGVP